MPETILLAVSACFGELDDLTTTPVTTPFSAILKLIAA
jgi:hypothetical protein